MITIVGAGKVGATTALFTAIKKLDNEIVLIDIAKELANGEAMDLNHMLSEQGIDVEINGYDDYSKISNSDIVVVVAGSGRRPGMTRLDLLNTNIKIVKKIAENIKKYAGDSIIIPVTNPVDPITYAMYKESNFNRNRIIGMGNMLDVSRFKQLIHKYIQYSNTSINGLVIGEHGDNMIPLTRFSTVAGIQLESMLTKKNLENIINDTKYAAARVIELKGATVFAPANAISEIIEAIKKDKKQIMPVSACINGEYGHSNVAIGVPAVIGKKGIEKIIELNLNDDEKKQFTSAVNNIKNAISKTVYN